MMTLSLPVSSWYTQTDGRCIELGESVDDMLYCMFIVRTKSYTDLHCNKVHGSLSRFHTGCFFTVVITFTLHSGARVAPGPLRASGASSVQPLAWAPMSLTHLDADSTSYIIALLDPASVYALGATCGQLSSLAHAHREDEPERFHIHWLAQLQRCIQEDHAASGYPRVTCFLRTSHSRAASIFGPAQRSLIDTLDQVLADTLSEPHLAPAVRVEDLASACGRTIAAVGPGLEPNMVGWMVEGLQEEEQGWNLAWSEYLSEDWDGMIDPTSAPKNPNAITEAFVRTVHLLP